VLRRGGTGDPSPKEQISVNNRDSEQPDQLRARVDPHTKQEARRKKKIESDEKGAFGSQRQPDLNKVMEKTTRCAHGHSTGESGKRNMRTEAKAHRLIRLQPACRTQVLDRGRSSGTEKKLLEWPGTHRLNIAPRTQPGC